MSTKIISKAARLRFSNNVYSVGATVTALRAPETPAEKSIVEDLLLAQALLVGALIRLDEQLGDAV